MTTEMKEVIFRMKKNLEHYVEIGDMEGAGLVRDTIKALKELANIDSKLGAKR